ncbi:MAG: porin family protein [Cyclobacteriaceae bacterium]
MKKLALLLLFNLAISFHLLAQVFIGVKAGGALTNNVYDGVGISGGFGIGSLKTSYLGGFFAEALLSENFSIQPELLYNNKGYTAIDNGPLSLHYNLHYVSVPIMLQYRVLDRLIVELGPEIGYLLDATSNRSSRGIFMGIPSFDEQLLSSYKDLDLALNMGIGYLLSDKWSLNLRYNMGLYDVTEDFYTSVFELDEPVLISSPVYNRSLQLSISYRVF